MTYQLAVWHSDVAIDHRQASHIYRHLNTDWVMLRQHPDFDAFRAALVERCPDPTWDSTGRPTDDLPASFLLTMADLASLPKGGPPDKSPRREPTILNEDSSWAETLSPHGCSIVLSIASGHAEQTEDIVHDLARAHRLVVYNPQAGKVSLPAQLDGLPVATSIDAKAKLAIQGKANALTATMTIAGKEVFSLPFETRTLAHQAAREAALHAGESLYEFHDPACLAQRMQLSLS